MRACFSTKVQGPSWLTEAPKCHYYINQGTVWVRKSSMNTTKLVWRSWLRSGERKQIFTIQAPYPVSAWVTNSRIYFVLIWTMNWSNYFIVPVSLFSLITMSKPGWDLFAKNPSKNYCPIFPFCTHHAKQKIWKSDIKRYSCYGSECLKYGHKCCPHRQSPPTPRQTLWRKPNGPTLNSHLATQP